MRNLKKWMSIALAVSLVATAPTVSVLAEGETTGAEAAENEAVTSGTCGENVTWVLEDGTLTISGSGEMIESDETPFFNFKPQIVSVVIEEGVTSIGKQSFWHCTNLTKVTIPNSVTNIGRNAFRDCSSLPEVNIPSGVSRIGEMAFKDCSNLKNVSIPNSVTTIEYGAFNSCANLQEVTIPKSVISIGYKTFSDCEGLSTICFEGDAPELSEHDEYGTKYTGDVFDNVTATAYYPAGNPTWTDEVKQSFGGNITWKEAVALEIQPEFTDTSYVVGSSEGATIKCSGALADFVSVAVDGVIVDPSNYTLKEGSTILTFTKAFMDTLSAGEHNITMNYTYGAIDTKLKVTASDSTNTDNSANTETGNTGAANANNSSTADTTNNSTATTKSPKTGDNSHIFLWVFAAFSAGSCLVVTKGRRRIQR